MVFETDCNILKVRITKPKSRENLNNLTKQIRKQLGIGSEQLYVDILYCLEILIPLIDSDFHYEVIEETLDEMPNEAFYSPEKNCISIRSDVYDKARDEDGRARFTIAHEIAHYFLFKKLGIPYFEKWEKVMNYSDAKLHSIDPEWQADVVGSYLLCGSEGIKNLSKEDIAFSCGVTKAAAFTAWQNAHGLKFIDYSAILRNNAFSNKKRRYSL